MDLNLKHQIQYGSHFYYQDKIVKVVALSKDYITIQFEDKTFLPVLYSQIRPLELESNVLLRYGFISTKDNVIYEINIPNSYCYLYLDNNKWFVGTKFQIHYLHQLQSLIRLLDPNIDACFF